ncbi:hypothetical protein NQ318_002142 [Aromia moschata]|uniref:Uncharacterized protein n=1 Tax=Aromia moschata TaxID=1265417 RepID=A0AAV8Y098_9CUCU|nr:hypothetical protein NQ318_002142 [Aromia moschata]
MVLLNKVMARSALRVRHAEDGIVDAPRSVTSDDDMALLNYSAPYLATPNPPTTNYYRAPQPPLLPLAPPQGPYSYPAPQKPFLAEEYGPRTSHQYHAQRHGGAGVAQHPQQQQHQPVQPTFTKVTDDGTKTKVHAVIDYDYDDDEEAGGGRASLR